MVAVLEKSTMLGQFRLSSGGSGISITVVCSALKWSRSDSLGRDPVGSGVHPVAGFSTCREPFILCLARDVLAGAAGFSGPKCSAWSSRPHRRFDAKSGGAYHLGPAALAANGLATRAKISIKLNLPVGN
jgi:hypothetical protein